MKNETTPALRLTPVRETTASVPLAVAERSLAALPVYGGLLGTLCALFGWSALWPAMAAGAAALALAVWCAMSRGWRQWLPALLALAAAAWCLLLPQARDSAAGLFNGVLAYVQSLTGRIHLPLACGETAALWAALPACIVLGALLGSLAVYAPAVNIVLVAAGVALAAVSGSADGAWWLALLCLGAALLCLGSRRSCRRSPAVSLWTAALAVLLAALTVGVTVITGLGASWNTTSAGETVRKAVHALRYENEHQAMPEGDFSTGVDFSDTPMLEVTLSRPESLYLRGFIGQRYTRDGWTALDAGELSHQANDVYWLQSADFFSQTQLSQLAALLKLDTPQIDVQLDVSGACRRFALLPYELSDSGVCDPYQLRDTLPEGEKHYAYTTSGNLTARAYELLDVLSQHLEDPQLKNYLAQETVYRQLVYDNYLTIPEDTQKTLTGFLGKAPTSITSYEAKSRIRSCLAEMVEYDESPVALPEDADPVSSFLQETGRGSAVQYATTAVMMLRYYGIPARYVEGYLVTPDMVSGKSGETTLTLTGNDAHAWAEYYEDGVGWVPFETAQPYLNLMAESDWRWFQPDENADLTGAQVQEGDGSRNDTVRHSTVETVDRPNDEPQVITIWKEFASTVQSGFSALHMGRWLILLLILALVLLAVLVILRRGKICRKRQVAFDDPDPREGAAALFAYAMELMWRGGLKRENRSLLTESAAVSAWAGETVDMEALAWLNAEARYSAHPITETQRQTMRQFAADTLRRFRQKLKPWQRFYQKWFRCMY